MKNWNWILGLTLTASAGNAMAAAIYDELDSGQKKMLQSGQPVLVVQNEPGLTWPKIRVYQRVEATAEEAAAVFSDYDRHKAYLPDVIKSETSSASGAITFVDYTVKMPWPFANQSYTTRNALSFNGDGAYRFDWVLARSDAAKSGNGVIKFEPLGTGAIIDYYSYVVPRSEAAALVKGKAIEMVKKTVVALAKEIDRIRTRDHAFLQQQLARFRETLR